MTPHFFIEQKNNLVSHKNVFFQRKKLFLLFEKKLDFCSLASALENCVNLTCLSSLVHVMRVCVCVCVCVDNFTIGLVEDRKKE